MKKQICILVMVLFTTTMAFGQKMTKGSDPQKLSCNPGPLNPLAGVSYEYSATVDPANGNFTWWATKDHDFIITTAGVATNNLAKKLPVGPGNLTATSANYGIAGGPTNASTVKITWSSEILAGTTSVSPTFVVMQNDATGTNCANNLKVYQINPINGFTVDIKNMDQAKVTRAYDADPYSFCVSNIASAKFSNGAIVTDYGTNVMYFEVVAANFATGYTPSFKVSGLQTGQTITSLELYTDAAFTSSVIATTLKGDVYSTAEPVAVDGGTNTSTGVSLYVKLTIANGTYETLANEPITLAVNGENTFFEKDVVNTDCATKTDYEDTATQTLTARPKVTATTGSFVTP